MKFAFFVIVLLAVVATFAEGTFRPRPILHRPILRPIIRPVVPIIRPLGPIIL